MKTFLTTKQIRILVKPILFVTLLAINVSAKAQTYTTIRNGAWNSASTWQGGTIPNAASLPLSAVINIKHRVTYSGSDIVNNGIINISNGTGLSPRLSVAGGINFTNNPGAKFYIINGEYRQYRFLGGLEIGVIQLGTFTNYGTVQIRNSFVEVAQDWSNQNTGTVTFRNSSLVIGRDYECKNGAKDTTSYTSVSVGMQGTGDYTVNGGTCQSYYQVARVQVASIAGKFNLNSGTINGSIDYILLKNHVTGLYSTDKIVVNNSVITTGLALNAYCIGNASNYQPNGKFTGAQTPNCATNYFPATLYGSVAFSGLNLSILPTLVSGTDKQAGAVYKYESVVSGVDMILSIDSIVNGATITQLDNNTGYVEGFQPQITTGSAVGQSYAVFNFNFKITGTSVNKYLDTLKMTALDIDGSSNLKEFDQITLGNGTTAAYLNGSPVISLSQVSPGTFKGINVDGLDKSNVDTAAKENMFTVMNTNVSSFAIKLGAVTTQSQTTSRMYSVYMKGFIYPNTSTLPVKMTSFTATLNKNNKADLKWTTASEINVSHFVIQKSTDGQNFTDVGIMFAYGNISDKTNYSFSDDLAATKAPVIYYRLCSVDIDGKTQYSETRIIRITTQTDNAITILTYPNPATNEIRVTIPSTWQNKKVSYEVVNVNGQTAARIQSASAGQTETINMRQMAPGFYVVKVSCGTETAQQRIVKQ